MALIVVNGTLKDTTGAVVVGSVKFRLVNFDNKIPTIGTTNLLSTNPVTVTCNGSGIFTVSLQGNDTITPTGTLYEVTLFDANGNSFFVALYKFTGAGPINLNGFAQS